ncbi:D-TA family PLP-dependent enzyme [Oceanobacillus sp. FSL K6-2867]|uniref:D-TA family PLP-dependent enzyme n=1 Tax=Oceanobacillus sp. FSL K6-2867 TaxID=2954748 RepID=UPI0030DD782F
MHYKEMDTPALLIDQDILMRNIKDMQAYADKQNVKLRPHTKTHKMPKLALLQEKHGASGITVAKVGEAEVMARHGLDNIFIANEVVGKQKIQRIRELANSINISFGIDSVYQLNEIEEVFEGATNKAQVLIEIEVGENRSGVIEEEVFRELVNAVKNSSNVNLKGVFSHDGHTYAAENVEHCKELYTASAERTLHFAGICTELGVSPEVVSIGSTPPFLFGFDIPEGVTEIRPGTYILMDASQSNAFGSFEKAAATVLTTIISKPTGERVITDVGAKGITAQKRTKGITATTGLGKIKEYEDVHVDGVFDEHAIIYNKAFSEQVNIGDKVQIIPNHICPVSNLHEKAYLIQDGKVMDEVIVECRGKLQ